MLNEYGDVHEEFDARRREELQETIHSKRKSLVTRQDVAELEVILQALGDSETICMLSSSS